MANFVGADVKQIFNNTIDKLRQDIGRPVVVISTATTIDCPNCGWDDFKKRSNGRYEPDSPYPAGITGPVDFVSQNKLHCPVCGGKGRIETAENRSNVICLISVLAKEDAEVTPLGKNYSRNYELSATIDNQASFEKAEYVIVDGQVCKVVGVTPGGIGDLTQVTVYAGG